MIWLLLGCPNRVPLAQLVEHPVALSVQIPAGRAPSGDLEVNAVVFDQDVRGTGAGRDTNERVDVAPGVRVQCELYRRRLAVSLFVDVTAAPGTWETRCPVGGVPLPVTAEVVR